VLCCFAGRCTTHGYRGATILIMDPFAAAGLYALLLWVIGACITLLALYGVIRVGVSRGMRDHYKWVKKNHPNGGQVPPGRSTIGQYSE
jgi:hypothetical protein